MIKWNNKEYYIDNLTKKTQIEEDKETREDKETGEDKETREDKETGEDTDEKEQQKDYHITINKNVMLPVTSKGDKSITVLNKKYLPIKLIHEIKPIEEVSPSGIKLSNLKKLQKKIINRTNITGYQLIYYIEKD